MFFALTVNVALREVGHGGSAPAAVPGLPGFTFVCLHTSKFVQLIRSTARLRPTEGVRSTAEGSPGAFEYLAHHSVPVGKGEGEVGSTQS